MNTSASGKRALDPLERFSEIVFGLIMALSFTCAISVASSGREEMRTMLLGAITCNLAWGIIDAVFYLIACLTGHARRALLVREVQGSPDSSSARGIVSRALPPAIADTLQPADIDRIQSFIRQAPAPSKRLHLTADDWKGALAVFFLVFISTLPLVLPFLVMSDPRFALRVSNAIAMILLFGAGRMLAIYAGLPPIATGVTMVLTGGVLVALTIALGG